MKWIVSLCGLVLFSLSMRAEEHVVLLHGLARSAQSMNPIEEALTEDGYTVHNVDYPSREKSIAELAVQVRAEVDRLALDAATVHFVTHSMGDILVRQMVSDQAFPNMGRVVMLSPPNNGSEVVDRLGGLKLFRKLNGPAGGELGTGEGSVPLKLGPANFEVGIITGDRSINWILSTMLPGKNDGKVSVESAKLKGMKAFRVVHASHPMIMKKAKVIEMVKRFLAEGDFEEE